MFRVSDRLALLASCLLPLHAFGAEVQSLAELAAVKPVMECAALKESTVPLPGGVRARIASAESVNGEAAAYCRVRGTIASAIGFEAQLPSANWSQRYLQIGCGGLCGSIQLRVNNAAGCVPAESGTLALASTDMGHQGSMGEGTFGNDPQARIDFAYRGVHLTAVAVKLIIRKFYGQAARYSYFSGCSDGGREALMEAQRFPEDFDGIAAGAPAMNFQVQNTFYHAWQALSNTGPDGRAILTAERLPLLHRAAVASCDEIDGLKDGQITDPRQCKFDPASLQCPTAKAGEACLTASEVAAATALYRGAHTADAERLVIGGPQVGSELSWAGVFVPQRADEPIFSSMAALSVLRYVAFETNSTTFSLSDLKFDRETFERLRPLHALYDATDPNLGPFARHGKLILWHGWSDPHISPINTIAYFEAMQQELGASQTDAFARLFLFPGMYHCSGGDGPSQFDVLTPLMRWVERGNAPAEIVAGRTIGTQTPTGRPRTADGPRPAIVKSSPVDRTRPIYPYPAVASYRGSGSLEEAGSFASRPGSKGPAQYDWVGRTFMTPGFHRSCVAQSDKQSGKLECPADGSRR